MQRSPSQISTRTPRSTSSRSWPWRIAWQTSLCHLCPPKSRPPSAINLRLPKLQRMNCQAALTATRVRSRQSPLLFLFFFSFSVFFATACFVYSPQASRTYFCSLALRRGCVIVWLLLCVSALFSFTHHASLFSFSFLFVESA